MPVVERQLVLGIGPGDEPAIVPEKRLQGECFGVDFQRAVLTEQRLVLIAVGAERAQ
jgi:hypothetical protein